MIRRIPFYHDAGISRLRPLVVVPFLMLGACSGDSDEAKSTGASSQVSLAIPERLQAASLHGRIRRSMSARAPTR